MAKIKSDCEDMNLSKPTISVALTMISIPLSMILWIGNILFKKLYGDNVNQIDGKLINLKILTINNSLLVKFIIYYIIII